MMSCIVAKVRTITVSDDLTSLQPHLLSFIVHVTCKLFQCHSHKSWYSDGWFLVTCKLFYCHTHDMPMFESMSTCKLFGHSVDLPMVDPMSPNDYISVMLMICRWLTQDWRESDTAPGLCSSQLCRKWGNTGADTGQRRRSHGAETPTPVLRITQPAEHNIQ